MTPRIAAILALLLLGASACGGCGPDPTPAPTPTPQKTTAEAPESDPVIATVGASVIRRSALEDGYREALRLRASSTRAISPKWRERTRARLLDRLVEDALVRHAIATRPVVIDDDAVTREVTARIARTFKTERGLMAHLERTGVTEPQYREAVRHDLAEAALLNVDPNITESEARAIYTQRADSYQARARVSLAVIVIRVPPGSTPEAVAAIGERAETIARLARQRGTRFADVARKHSEGPTAPAGGAIGWAERRELEDAVALQAFSLPVGAVSPPIKTKLGFQILKVVERKEGGQRAFEEVRPKIEAQLRTQRLATARAELVAQLRENIKVEIKRDRLR